jgi:hypothetical protein
VLACNFFHNNRCRTISLCAESLGKAQDRESRRAAVSCYSASSERKLLLHKLMCIDLSAVVIALCRAIRVVCLHDVSMIAIGVEGADQGGEEPSYHHVAPRMFLPHEPSHI